MADPVTPGAEGATPADNAPAPDPSKAPDPSAAENAGAEGAEAGADEGAGKEGSGDKDGGKASQTDKPDDKGGKDGKDGEKDDKSDADELRGAPEDDYEDFELPEGFEIDEAAMGKFKPLAKELDLSQKGAQELVNLFTETLKEQHEASAKAFSDMQEEWRTEVQADSEIGGKNLDKSLGHALNFIRTFGDDALVEALEVTGTGNHPAIIRAFARAGKAIGNDEIHLGGASSGANKDVASLLFPNQGKQQ